MTPQSQLTNTDCLRACVATLLDEPILSVPDFAGYENAMEVDERTGYHTWWMALQLWLHERGLFFLEVRIGGSFFVEQEIMTNDDGLPSGEKEQIEVQVQTPWNPLPYECYCILVGNTKGGVRHMCVGKALGGSFQRVFDPHPKQPGIAQLEGVCFLVPTDPGLIPKMGKSLEAIESLAMAPVINNTIAGAIITNARHGLNKSAIIGG